MRAVNPVSFLSRLGDLFRRRRRVVVPSPTIEVTAAGFVALTPGAAPIAVAWEEVRRAVAYKRDLYTTDQIVLAFELDRPDLPLLELSEESPGFASLFGPMEEVLGVSPSWYLEIMLPAFEPTPRVLYNRGAASAGAGENQERTDAGS